MHKNTKWLIDWADRMHSKFGPPVMGLDWCRRLAYYLDEQGNDHPSDFAIEVAKKWERIKDQKNINDSENTKQ